MDNAIFFKEIKNHPFGGRISQSQVDGVNAILEGWEREKWAPHADARSIAYSLATAYWETGQTMQPVREGGRGKGRAYGVPSGPFGGVYYGRGLVQLTWEKNYIRATKRLRELGVLGSVDDLSRDPDLALRPDIAVAIMVCGMSEGWFTGRRLAHYFAGSRSDWVDARAIINGRDKARLIAGFAMQFYHALDVAAA